MSSPEGHPSPWSREGQDAPQVNYGNYGQPGHGQPVWPGYQGYQGYQPPPPPPPPIPPQRKRHTRLWVTLGAAVAVLIGFIVWGAARETWSTTSTSGSGTQSAAASGTTKVVTASDHKSQLTVPQSWVDLPARFRNDAAVIQLGDPVREQYVVVVPNAKGDFKDFDGFVSAIVDNADTAVQEAAVGKPSDLSIGGLSAVRFEVTGKSGGVRAVFWFTLVEGKGAYYSVIGWTLPSKRDEAQAPITEAASTFREVTP